VALRDFTEGLDKLNTKDVHLFSGFFAEFDSKYSGYVDK
jgi:hypothetical protein